MSIERMESKSSLTTLLSVNQEHSLSTFQLDVNALEEEQNYYGALKLCVTAASEMQSELETPSLSPLRVLELQYYLDVAIARARFLLNYISMETSKKFNDHPTISTISEILPLKKKFANPVATEVLNELFKSVDSIDYQGYELHKSDIIQSAVPNDSDFEKLKQTLAGAVTIVNPNVSFDMIIGMDEAKDAIFEAIEIPNRYPKSGQAKNAWQGILLFGPSGVGKTELIKAVASESRMTFLSVTADVLVSKWQGETEKSIRAVFEIARERSPSIIFIDECDQFCRERGTSDGDTSSRIKSTLLTEMDGIGRESKEKLIVIGNTNLPQLLDDAFLRRFPKKIFVDLPDQHDRVLLLQYFMSDYNHAVSASQLATISSRLIRYSGSDIKTLVAQAGLVQFKGQRKSNLEHFQNLRDVEKNDFDAAMKFVKPTNKEKLLINLRRWNEDNGGGGASTVYADVLEARKKWKQEKIAFRMVSAILLFFSGN